MAISLSVTAADSGRTHLLHQSLACAAPNCQKRRSLPADCFHSRYNAHMMLGNRSEVADGPCCEIGTNLLAARFHAPRAMRLKWRLAVPLGCRRQQGPTAVEE